MSAVAADAALTRDADFDWPWAAVCDHLFLRLFLAVRVIHCFRHSRPNMHRRLCRLAINSIAHCARRYWATAIFNQKPSNPEGGASVGIQPTAAHHSQQQEHRRGDGGGQHGA